MTYGIQTYKSEIVAGSLQAEAARTAVTLAEIMVNMKVLALVDTSFSMKTSDAGDNQTRIDRAIHDLTALQRASPGVVGVVSFSDEAIFCAGGQPEDQSSGTDMVKALQYALPYDGLVRIVMISDGEPNRVEDTLEVARLFKAPIETIYCGPKDGEGCEFLKRLAKLTNGMFAQTAEPGALLAPMKDVLQLTARK